MKSPTVRAGRVIDAQLHLLDRQVLDREGTRPSRPSTMWS